MSYRLYWGDLHSHCSISYGEGTVEQALLRARQQLDFCSITGHAFWPDMPRDRLRYGQIIDYHREGFARLARNWEALLAAQQAASQEGQFIAFPSYEWHSLEYGDHNVYGRGPQLELVDAPDLPALRAAARRQRAILVPHHIGYAAGYRGIDWRHFRDELSPLVEIYSLHGCSESESAPYPMLHDMGPRDAGSTAEAGWAAGHRFGVIASTDHHGGFPGSHGDGRVGVFASALTREALWQALLERRVLAATGDKIDARLHIEGAWIGQTVRCPSTRHIEIDVTGLDALDRVELIKNGRVLERLFPTAGIADSRRARLRITWGWGRKNQCVPWEVRLTLSDGEILQVEPCFSGQSVVAPQGVAGHMAQADVEDLPHRVLDQGPRSVAWRSVTSGNLSTRHPTLQSLVLDVDLPPDARVRVETADRVFEHDARELLGGGRVHYLHGWLSEALRIGPLTPLSECRLSAAFADPPEHGVDVYRLRAAQLNGQWVWLTPIWVER